MERIRTHNYTPLNSSHEAVQGWYAMNASQKLSEQVIYTSIKQIHMEPVGKKVKRKVRARGQIVHSGIGVHEGLENRLKERDIKKASGRRCGARGV